MKWVLPDFLLLKLKCVMFAVAGEIGRVWMVPWNHLWQPFIPCSFRLMSQTSVRWQWKHKCPAWGHTDIDADCVVIFASFQPLSKAKFNNYLMSLHPCLNKTDNVLVSVFEVPSFNITPHTIPRGPLSTVNNPKSKMKLQRQYREAGLYLGSMLQRKH